MPHFIEQRIEWDAGHRVLGHAGKCRHLHGHRYAAVIVCTSKELDGLGMVIDFGVVKKLVGDWVNKNWDHNMILNNNDPLYLVYVSPRGGDVFEKKPFWLPVNPTAEVLAEVLFKVARDLLTSTGIVVKSVRVFETPNCSAVYEE